MTADSDLSTDAYLPRLPPGREERLKQIRTHLSAAVTGRQPDHLWIYGPAGSGKTAYVTAVLKEMEQNAGRFRWIALNCWLDHTLYLLADRMSREWRVLDGHGMTAVSKLRAIRKFTADRPTIIVLDELDKLAPKERNKVLYSLADLGKVGLVCISSSLDSAWELEERILSRLSPKAIPFEAYSVPELASTLRQRLGSVPCEEGSIERIAQLANGDMRVALRLLKSAVHAAERDSSDLRREHVDTAFGSRPRPDAYRLAKLGAHEQLIYGLIEARAGIRSGELRKAYEELCRQKAMPAIAERTFLKSLHRLKNAHLIRWTWVSGKGRAREFRTHSLTG
jgi:cell division control protein 6